MTDSPIVPAAVDAPTQWPGGQLERWAGFIGQIARPLAILLTAFGAMAATIIIALKVKDGNDGFLFIGGVFTGVAALYIGKAVEVWKTNQAAASVEKAKAATPS